MFFLVDLAELAEKYADSSVEFDEPANTATHPDEMDDYYEEPEAVNDELKRLQEVTEIDDNNSDEDEDEFYATIAQDKLIHNRPRQYRRASKNKT